MAEGVGNFTWYELMTTDVAAAVAFYRDVVGWESREASTPKLRYTLFTADETPAAGLMELPEEGLRMGARPRWMAYVGVNDVYATADRIKRLGGAIYVPPAETNIGRISVVADPLAAAFAVIDRSSARPLETALSNKLGRIGWHELLAADLGREVAFYSELFGWQSKETENHLTDDYRSFSAGGQVIGGAFTKRPDEPVPFWLLYFNVEDLHAAAARVVAGGGQVRLNDEELPGGFWIARCSDPQGAAFALQGKQAHTPNVGWRTEWHGFSSRGQLVKSRRSPPGDS